MHPHIRGRVHDFFEPLRVHRLIESNAEDQRDITSHVSSRNPDEGETTTTTKGNLTFRNSQADVGAEQLDLGCHRPEQVEAAG